MFIPSSLPVFLNQRAASLCQAMIADAERLKIAVHQRPDGGTTVDLGISVEGGLEAGRRLAEVCLAGLAEVSLVPGRIEGISAPSVQVCTDLPVAACMASQYAGWQIAGEKFFGMGSGPMRAAAAKEALFRKIGHTERPALAVGVLETRKLPPEAVCQDIARQCGVEVPALTLLAAPTASQAGHVQVVARSVETALHKLLELGFDLSLVQSGYGLAPLPPVAADDMAGIGRTNDAILYGGEVTLWVRADDEELARLGPQVPSCASSDYGQPFAAIFERAERDFYKIDPHLFSPAVITLANLATGRRFQFGRLAPDVLRQSFGANL
ncbi:MAG: methenyltetrahydromethanopterin cyclohydrolase [Pirellulales bacterium]